MRIDILTLFPEMFAPLQHSIVGRAVKNELLQDLESMVEEGKAQGVVNAATDSRRAAETLWLIVTSISRMLAGNTGYPYHDARDTMLYGVQAVFETMKIR